MAKTYILKERGTGATLYPQTIFKQVYGPDGRNLEAVLPDMQEQINAGQPSEPGKGLSANDYTDTDKAAVGEWAEWKSQFSRKGFYLHPLQNNNLYADSTAALSDLIPINHSWPVVVESNVYGNASALALYDRNGKFIGGINHSQAHPAINGKISVEAINEAERKFRYTFDPDSIPEAFYFVGGSMGWGSYRNSPTLEAVQGATAQAIQASKVALFDDLWRQAVGTYGTVDHSHVEDDGVERHYYLNKLWLTYGEAMATYEAGWPHNNAMTAQIYSGAAAKIRTNLPLRISTYRGGFGEFCFANPTIEIVRLSSNTCIFDGNYGFYHCSKLREVIGKIIARVRYICNGCPNLTSITIAIDDGVDLQIQDCPLLNLDSFKYMVDNSKNCSMAVHPDVFAKLTGDTGNAAAAALSPEEMAQWMALPELAAEKNIQIALAEQI